MSASARTAARLQALQTRQADRLSAALGRFFRAQAGRVTSRLLGGSKAVWWKATDPLVPKSEDRELRLLIEPVLRALYEQVGGLAADMAGGEPLTDAQLTALLEQAGERIAGINEETRAAIQRVLAAGREQGYSDYQIAHGVEADGFRGLRDIVAGMSEGRAQTIARTEVATASQDSAHAVWHEVGVTEVDIIDGEGCGWDGHDDADEANGSRRTLAEARKQPISHPNCVRVSLPVLESRRRGRH